MKNLILIFLIISITGIYAQEDKIEKKEKIKKGFSMGGIPIVSFGNDIGFQYGVAVNLYHYGDGSNYPNYDHSLFLQWSRTTKGGETNLLSYDALTLIPKTRMTITLAYLTEQAMDFYGFNGYQGYYNKAFETMDSNEYISRMYYKYSRKLFFSTIDFQKKASIKNVRYLAGLTHFDLRIASVDIDKLNEGKEADDLLPQTDLLYDKYIKWGVIPEAQSQGGKISYLKLGTVYDSRDNEANPNKGIWSEVILITAPGFANDYAFTKLLLTHRQYFTLSRNLTFVYRLSYQPKLTGEIPFYMLSFITDSKKTVEGLGGSKTLRGISRNRIVGDGVALANMELRSKFLKTVIFNQNFYMGVNLFTDMGMVTQPYKFKYTSQNNQEEDNTNLETLNYKNESLHLSYGAGLYSVINNNFVIAIDYGLTTNTTDGSGGLYIGLNYLF